MKRPMPPQINRLDARRILVEVALPPLLLFWLSACNGSFHANSLLAADDQGAAEAATGEQTHKQKRKEELEEMRRRAQSTKVRQFRGADKIAAELVPEPVLRYSSEFHKVIDATVWLYGTRGRPVAVQEVVCHRLPGVPKYFYCLSSLSDGLIEARWPGDADWSSTKPGVELRVLPGGPKPASTENGRILQMKELIGRFTATRIDPGDIREEDRPLHRPIGRYRDPDSGLQDGAIFVFVANGTAPDFLLLLELRGPDLGRATWNYGAQRVTTGELHLRLDGKEVWSVPWEFTPDRHVRDTWLFFFTSQQKPGR